MNGMRWLQTAADGTIALLLKGDFGACVLMFVKISLALVFFLFTLFLGSIMPDQSIAFDVLYVL